MSHRNLVILTKIILFYSLFFIFMKTVILFQGAWLIPNLVLMLPFVILTFLAWRQVKTENYSWFFVAIGAATIILIRVYETELAFWIQQHVIS